MSNFDAGTSVGKYILQADQALKVQQQLIKGFEQIAKASAVKPPAVATPTASAAVPRQIANLNALRNSEIAAARAAGDHAKALELIQAELARTAQGTVRYNQLLAQQSRAQNAVARQSATGLGTAGGLPILPRTVESFGTQAIDQFKSGLLGIVGPAAVAGAAITALTVTADSFRRAFTFKAELDATTRAITTNLEGVRNQAAVFREAQGFADRYRLTQKETTEILANSTDILRTSTASVTDLEGALLRLQSRDPSKPISEAARALRELNSGDTTTIKELFNISAANANRMKNEIAAGGDAVAVLNGYLDRAGISMEVLENRSKGVAGAMNEQAIAQEQLALAQAKFSEGPGLALLRTETELTRDATRLLSGDISSLNDALIQLNVGGLNPVLKPLLDYNTFVLDAGQKALVWAGVLQETNPELANQAGATDAATQAALSYANRVRQAGDDALLAAGKVDELTAAQRRQAAAQGLSDQRAGERSPGASGAAEAAAEDERRAQAVFRRLAQPERERKAREAQQDADQIARARARLEESQAITSAQKIALARKRLNAASGEAERLEAQAQLNDLLAQQTRASAGHTSELNKQVGLEERIRDSKEAQLKASLDAAAATIKDRQDRRKEDQEIRAAQRIIGSGRASQQFKDAAQDRLSLIDIERQQRALAIAQQQATAGGTIVNGRVLQSIQSGGAPIPAGAVPTIIGQPIAQAPIGPIPMPPITVNVYLDNAQIAAKQIEILHGDLRRAQSAGVG